MTRWLHSAAFGCACVLAVLFAQGCADESSSCTAPRLAPNQPNGSSPLAAAMVAMDGQLQQTMQAVMSDPSHSWKGQTLISHALLGLEPTDESMVNDHFESHAPLYQLAIEQFNAQPSASHFNAVVTACENCHLGTCPGPLERIAKRRVEPSH